jgi:hypothetical protein
LQITILQGQLNVDISFLLQKHIEQLICCMVVILLLQFKHILALIHFFSHSKHKKHPHPIFKLQLLFLQTKHFLVSISSSTLILFLLKSFINSNSLILLLFISSCKGFLLILLLLNKEGEGDPEDKENAFKKNVVLLERG